jgi:hypothetical protein
VCYRLNGPGQTLSNVEMGSPPTHDLQAAYIPSMSKPFHLTPHISQNSPSRFGHQSVQRFTHGRPPQGSDWNQIKIQAPSNFSNVGPRSPRNASFTGNMTWGMYYLPDGFMHPLFSFFLNLLFGFITPAPLIFFLDTWTLASWATWLFRVVYSAGSLEGLDLLWIQEFDITT